MVADDEGFAVGRNAVIIVATDGEAGVVDLRFATFERQVVNAPFAVEQESVSQPVRRFDVIGGGVDGATIFRRNRYRLESADESLRFWRTLARRAQLDAGEHGAFDGIAVMGADAKADVER